MSTIPQKFQRIFDEFSVHYRAIVAEAGMTPEAGDHLLGQFMWCLDQQARHPHTFEPFHRLISEPFDYYTFGVEFFRPLIDKARSTLTGQEHLRRIVAQQAAGENVIYLANHQTEADPQAISIMFEDEFRATGREMIFVAGERVTSDPLTAPFSLGRNLLCIYSKRYIDHPPELKAAKQSRNRKTMERMVELLAEGGHGIYVAPSGGRDRKNAAGVIEVAPFDAQSVEMFRVMAQRAGRPTHFYPMALSTYDFLPPPETVQVELGEQRRIKRCPVHIAIGAGLDLESVTGADSHERRVARADLAWRAVCEAYARFPTAISS